MYVKNCEQHFKNIPVYDGAVRQKKNICDSNKIVFTGSTVFSLNRLKVSDSIRSLLLGCNCDNYDPRLYKSITYTTRIVLCTVFNKIIFIYYPCGSAHVFV